MIFADEVKDSVDQYKKVEREYKYSFHPEEGDTRKPLAVGNKYMLKYDPKLGWFEITGFSFPKTSSDDGGAPGVSVEWYGKLRRSRGQNGWYVFNSEKQFWSDSYFKCAVDYVQGDK